MKIGPFHKNNKFDVFEEKHLAWKTLKAFFVLQSIDFVNASSHLFNFFAKFPLFHFSVQFHNSLTSSEEKYSCSNLIKKCRWCSWDYNPDLQELKA